MQQGPATPDIELSEASSPRQEFSIDFTGTGTEYFRIWIVNIALTVITLGIYSAWAKVRNKQYFYGHTRLAASAFEYTAKPVDILKGRLLVFSVLIIYQLASATQPMLAVAMGLALIPLLPWIVIKSVGFNLRYSSYRNLRFHFDGRYGQAFVLYILWSLVIGVSGGIAYPYVAWQRKRFLVDMTRFGRTHFNFSGEAGYFYVVYICAIVIYLVAMAGVGVAIGGIGALTQMGAGNENAGEAQALGIAVTILIALCFTVLVVTFNSAIQSLISNFIWQHTSLKNIGFDLKLEVMRVVWIQITNIMAIIVSLGLLIPWAKVRMLRYQLSRFSMYAPLQELDTFIASEREKLTATGGEFGEALDLDLGL